MDISPLIPACIDPMIAIEPMQKVRVAEINPWVKEPEAASPGATRRRSSCAKASSLPSRSNSSPNRVPTAMQITMPRESFVWMAPIMPSTATASARAVTRERVIRVLMRCLNRMPMRLPKTMAALLMIVASILQHLLKRNLSPAYRRHSLRRSALLYK